MATETRTITLRIGPYSKFDPEKFLPGEIGVVTSGDPYTKDGRAIYACFVSGIVKRFATYEDMLEYIQSATKDIQEQFTQELTDTIDSAKEILSAMNQATKDTALATKLANESAENANAAAEEAKKYVLGDISNKSAKFEKSAERENIVSGETLAVILGKIEKFFSDLKLFSFSGNYDHLNPVDYLKKEYEDPQVEEDGLITIPETTDFSNPQNIKELFGEIVAKINLQKKINNLYKERIDNLFFKKGEFSVDGTKVRYAKYGMVAQIYVDAMKMNKIPDCPAWNEATIISIPEELKFLYPSIEVVTKLKCDGNSVSVSANWLHGEWAQSLFAVLKTDGKICIKTRGTGFYNWDELGDGNALWLGFTYISAEQL